MEGEGRSQGEYIEMINCQKIAWMINSEMNLICDWAWMDIYNNNWNELASKNVINDYQIKKCSNINTGCEVNTGIIPKKKMIHTLQLLSQSN